jgi:hypothetical protein
LVRAVAISSKHHDKLLQNQLSNTELLELTTKKVHTLIESNEESKSVKDIRVKYVTERN